MPAFDFFLPRGYKSSLGIRETEMAIKAVKDGFERLLASALNLDRVSAPVFVPRNSGLNDNLNGIERPVSFDVAFEDGPIEIVHSLAKWKRMALKRYGYRIGEGIYTDMNAIRRDEMPDNLHSIYVDQWDWERVISKKDRTEEYLRRTVYAIVHAIKQAEVEVCSAFDLLNPFIKEECFFVSSQELLDAYPGLSPKERENAIAKDKKTVFISKIGGKLSDGSVHDSRAPDYDDWELNGDILIWYPALERAVELSSMGIRVSPESLARQLELSGHNERRELPFHKALLAGELPYSIGGGIGQSRLCMVLLGKAHIGEVQVSLWPREMQEVCEKHGINLL